MSRVKRMIPWIHGVLAYGALPIGAILLRRRARPPAARRRVCVLLMNAMGDVLMGTPLLRALGQGLPGGQVDVVVLEQTAGLLEGFPGLDRILRLPGHLRWRSPRSIWSYLGLLRELRARRYEAILDASRLLQSAWLAFLARPERGVGLRIRRRLGPFRVAGLSPLYTHEVDVPGDLHMVRENLALLHPLGVAAGSEVTSICPPPPHRRAAAAWLAARGVPAQQPLAVIHPGAKWPPRRWPASRFRVILSRLQGLGMAVVLLGDRGDRELLETLAADLRPGPLMTAGDLDLLTVASLIQRAQIFLGNDSGPAHLAVAVGTPAVVLFGPTLPAKVGPLGPPHRSLIRPIPCRPCRLYFTRDRCEQGRNACMDLLEVEEVWEALEPLLGTSTRPDPPEPA